MKPLKIILLLITIVFTPMLAIAAGKQALLIGIQDYSNTSFKSLKGPANDIELTKGMLRERFGFRDEDFIILKDAQATHTGIENAFNTLINRVKLGDDDFVYIFYSGHGSQTADLNGDESSGKDQTWVSYGSRSSTVEHKDNYDVLDDEIGDWLAKLYDKTDKVVFVSDSCHSATVSRAAERGEALVRAVKEDKRSHLLGKLTYAKPTTHLGIRVSAARDYESALDGLIKDEQAYGLFTWYWVHSLQQAKAGYTWHDVFKRTYAQVTAYRGIAQQPDMQQPQMEGKGHHLVQKRRLRELPPFFIPLPQTIPVYSIYEDKVKILVGSLAGVTKDSVYRLYDPKSLNLHNLPSITITKVTPFASYGNFESENAFKTGDLVVKESHAYHFEPIKVFLKADFPKEDKTLLQTIQSAFQSTPDDKTSSLFPYVLLTQDSSKTDLRLHLLRPKRRENGQLVYEKDDALPKSFSNQSPELWVLTTDGHLFNEKLRIPFDKPTEGVKLLKDNLKKWASIRELKALKSSNPVKVQIDILHQSQSELEGKNCLVDEKLGLYCKTGLYNLSTLNKHIPSLGDVLTFTLNNKSKNHYYCYLLDLNPNGDINVIYPHQSERTEFVRVKADETRKTGISLHLKNKGKRTLKLITSGQSIDVSLLEQSAYRPRAGSNPLERLLINAVHGLRGSQLISNDEWATEQVTFEVK